MNKGNTLTTEIHILNEDMANKLNFSILFIHVGLLISFTLMQAPIMVAVNIVSLLVYLYLFRIIKKSLVAYLIITYFEILVHMIIAAICMGWSCGFQLYCFAVVPLIYYAHYISKRLKKEFHPLPMVIAVIFSYLATNLISIFFPPIYDSISKTTANIIYIINSIVVFSFLIIFFSLYEKMGLSIEILLKNTAEYDVLTGLANRQKMGAIFEYLLSDENKSPFSIGILDIDNFKKVNDTYGHNVGDIILKNVANVLLEVEKDNIYACRWGGEEFLLLVVGDNSLETAKALLELIRVNVSNKITEHEDKKISVTISSGVTSHLNGESLVTTVGRADSYLYNAKKSGKNLVFTGDN